MQSKYYNLWQKELAQYLPLAKLSYDENQVQQLLSFLSMLEHYNNTHNLTRVKPADYVTVHVMDSLALAPKVTDMRFLDVGSGAGFPGIPLAIFAKPRAVILLDSAAKRCAFLRQVVSDVSLKNVAIVEKDIVKYKPTELFDVVVVRAFASLAKLEKMLSHVVSKKAGAIWAMKADLTTTELASINSSYLVEELQVPGLTAKRCLVKIIPQGVS